MRPYLAVIKDSFREAIASRVLPLLLVFFTLLLLALAPLGLHERTAWKLKPGEVRDWDMLFSQLKDVAEAGQPSPSKSIREMLSLELRELIDDYGQLGNSGRRRAHVKFSRELNERLEQRDFYDAAVWKEFTLEGEAAELVAEGIDNLSDDRVARLNRLLVSAAFPDQITPPPESSVELTYFGDNFWFGNILSANPAIGKQDIRIIVQGILALFCTWIVGKFGVFVAILVSANVIPRMYEAGSIDLLLSKPVSRTLLFLTKFFSGCMFILLAAGYFMIGLWLIVGLRMGIWSSNLLLAIPVFMFVFAIIYSISALAGVLWRNAIVSVMISIVLWGICMVLGLTREIMDGIQNAHRRAVVIEADDTLVTTNKSGEVFEWDTQNNSWEPVFQGGQTPALPLGMMYPMIGPVYDSQRDQIVAINSTPAQFAFMTGGASRLLYGPRSADWARLKGIATPMGVSQLFIAPDGDVVVAGSTGVFRLNGDPASGSFDRVVSQPAGEWETPFAAAMHPGDGSLVVYEQGNLSLLRRQGDRSYAFVKEADLQTHEPAVVALAGDSVVVALGDGRIQVFSAETLNSQAEFRPFGDQEPRSAFASADGRWFGVLYHDRRLWLYDAQRGEPIGRRVRGQGDVSAATFTRNGRLLVADRITRVSEYRLDPLEKTQAYEPASSTTELIYRYAIYPAYIILPKPGELDLVITYLFTDQKSEAIGDADNLAAERTVYNLRRPIWANLAFLSVMLSVTCLIVSRRDF